MKHIVDMETWSRKEDYGFFATLQNPNISITSEIKCEEALKRAKREQKSFFIYYMYALLAATNELPEFRFRIDNEERVIFFDTVDVMTPIKINEEGECAIVRIPWRENFEEFYALAKEIIDEAKSNNGAYNSAPEAGGETLDVTFLSATPDLYFTSLTSAQERRNGNSYPLVNVGKAVRREGELVMPVALTVHHGFVAGHHLSLFYKKVEEILNQL